MNAGSSYEGSRVDELSVHSWEDQEDFNVLHAR